MFIGRKPLRFQENLLCTSIAELSLSLSLMIQEAKGFEGKTLEADMLSYIFLCIQKVHAITLTICYVPYLYIFFLTFCFFSISFCSICLITIELIIYSVIIIISGSNNHCIRYYTHGSPVSLR